MSHSQRSSSVWTASVSESTDPLDERDFKRAFKRLCNKHKEYQSERLLNRLLDDHCGNIIFFADKLDEALSLENETFSGAFYSSLLKVIEVSWNHLNYSMFFEFRLMVCYTRVDWNLISHSLH